MYVDIAPAVHGLYLSLLETWIISFWDPFGTQYLRDLWTLGL